VSGHSKWATIKRRKGAEDAKRGKIFTRLGRDVMMAAREGGGDENANPKLKLAVIKARAANMPKENIDRAIKRGLGELDGGSVMEELTYEGYGVSGIAFIVECLTDNKNRTLAEVKNAFNKGGGSMANNGAVTWQFNQNGVIVLKNAGYNFDDVFMVAAEAGADDVENDEGTLTIYTPREAFGVVEQALSDAGYEIEDSGLRWLAQNETDVDVASGVKNMKLMERLEELDDVQTVASNMAISEDILNAFESA
jgi:YebC/PmpR family DNA-binding regulatory protein